MSNNAWLGIDLGTQSAKVLVVDDFGNTLTKTNRPLRSIRSGGLHEQSPHEWMGQTFECLREAMSSLPSGYKVQAVSTAGTSGTLAIANKHSLEIRDKGIMYDDPRGADYSSKAQRHGFDLWADLGYRIQDSWALPKMLWCLENEAIDQNEVFISQADVVHWALAKEPLASDSSHTLKSGFDLDRMIWPEKIFSDLGLPTTHLNDVVAPGKRIGSVSAKAAEETGLDEGTAIISGMTDGSAAQIASGAVSPGSWNSVLGTTLVLKGSSLRRHEDPAGSIYCHRAPFESGWWPGGASSTGTRAIESRMPDKDRDALDLSRSDVESAPIEYPLTGKGERFPFVSAEAEGFTLRDVSSGQKPTTNEFASIAVGVAMLERLSFDVVAFAGYEILGSIRFTGGGSNNPSWNQLRSSMLNRTALVPNESGSASGSAILARAAIEQASQSGFLEIVSQMVSINTELEPDQKLIAQMQDKYKKLVDEFTKRGWVSDELREFTERNLD
jgi:sugar (pentulose or hexulose) kinase